MEELPQVGGDTAQSIIFILDNNLIGCSVSRLMLKFGKSEFGFLPRTFILPTDTKLLRKVSKTEN